MAYNMKKETSAYEFFYHDVDNSLFSQWGEWQACHVLTSPEKGRGRLMKLASVCI
jgi:hypothetical protein